MRLTSIATLIAASAATLVLAGCYGLKPATTVATPQTLSISGLHGLAYGGQQPIYQATIQLYQAGTSGYGAGATALTASGVLTDATGHFSFNSTPYQCTSGSMVYITSTGGQPTTGITNSAATLMAGLGLCDNINSSTFISMNEVTTVGTVWALAPFINGINIGAPTTNTTGLVSAFADINTLVNTATGYANASTATVTLPTAEIYTLANSLAGCVNSSGPSSPGCSALFSAAPNADTSTPTDTVTAAINIARNPSRNVSSVIAAAGATPPFGPTLASATDLTLAATYTGSGITSPTAAAIDASGAVWITNAASVTRLTHTGANAAGSPFTAGGISAPTAIAIDTTGNAWITNGNSTLTELSSTGTSVGSSPFSGGGLSLPTSIAFDGLGNSWIANSGNNSLSEFSSTGAALSGASGYTTTGVTGPIGVAINPH